MAVGVSHVTGPGLGRPIRRPGLWPGTAVMCGRASIIVRECGCATGTWEWGQLAPSTHYRRHPAFPSVIPERALPKIVGQIR